VRHPDGGRQEQTVRELLVGRSPDRGDALVLAYHAWQAEHEYRAAERIDTNTPLIWTNDEQGDGHGPITPWPDWAL
jgi:hypothetical protein